MALTDLAVRNAKPKAKPYKLTDGGGLYLDIQPKGGKWWRYAYRFNGKQRTLALGVYDDVSLADAREAHAKARQTLASGRDPNEAKKEAKRLSILKSEATFESIAREWHERELHTWSPKHGANVIKRLEGDIFPKLGNRPVADITPPELLSVLKVIEKRDALDLTRTIAQYCSRIFTYAIATSRAGRNPSLDVRGALKTPVSKHYNYLQPDELPEFLLKLDAYEGMTQTKQALMMLILTFVRTTELRGMQWTEIDFEKAEWRVPAVRMKKKTPHIVPLSNQAISVLRDLKVRSGNRIYVFPNENRPNTFISENTMLYAMYRMGYHNRATVHGFRATATTILYENGYSKDLVERQMSHLERNKVRAAYDHAQFLPERRKMMEWWGNFIEGMISPTSNPQLNLVK